MAVGQHQWYHFWVGAPPILVYFSRDGDVHWGYGVLTHGHVSFVLLVFLEHRQTKGHLLQCPCCCKGKPKGENNHFAGSNLKKDEVPKWTPVATDLSHDPCRLRESWGIDAAEGFGRLLPVEGEIEVHLRSPRPYLAVGQK